MKPRPPKDSLKAARKGSREAEIAMYGHPLPKHKVHYSPKQYDRAKSKARLKNGEPCFCVL
jgi:transposase